MDEPQRRVEDMITYVPALEFIRGKAGRYCNDDSSVEVLIRPHRYGVSLEIRGPGQSHFLGVVGVRGEGLECFALVGLPNIMHFTVQFQPVAQSGGDGSIELNSEAVQLSLTLSFAGLSATFGYSGGGSVKQSVALLKA